MLTLIFCQVFLCLVLLFTLDTKPVNEQIPFTIYGAKFICGLALHLLVSDTQMQGLIMIKHTINHKYKFNHYGLVIIIAAMQVVVSFLCEILNFFYIISTNDPIDIVASFIAFYIIADLDSIYFKVLAETSIRVQLNEEMTAILTQRHVTSSEDARLEIEENKLTEENLMVARETFKLDDVDIVPAYIGISFK